MAVCAATSRLDRPLGPKVLFGQIQPEGPWIGAWRSTMANTSEGINYEMERSMDRTVESDKYRMDQKHEVTKKKRSREKAQYA